MMADEELRDARTFMAQQAADIEGLRGIIADLQSSLSAAEKEWRFAFAESQKQQKRAIRAEAVVEAAKDFENGMPPYKLFRAIRRYEEGE